MKNRTPVPKSMSIQFQRLFGAESKDGTKTERTDAEWKRILKKCLDDLFKYMEANVSSDELHSIMLYSAFYAASESLKEDNFWPGYVEGITRLTLLLMGDYPDHRRKKGGKKKGNHYDLQRLRNIIYLQNPTQKLNTLIASYNIGGFKLSKNPRDALSEFRSQHAYSAGYKEFINWYRKNYPEDYAAIF